MPLEKHEQGLARDFLHDRAREHITRVGVLPIRSRLEVERALRPFIDDGGWGRRMGHFGREKILRPVIPDAAGVRERLSQRDGARCAGQSWKPLDHGVIQRQLALLREQQDRGSREFLRHRVDGITRGGRRRHLGAQLGAAIGPRVRQSVVLHDGDRRRGGSGARQPFRDDAVHRGGIQRGVRGAARARGHAGQQNDSKR